MCKLISLWKFKNKKKILLFFLFIIFFLIFSLMYKNSCESIEKIEKYDKLSFIMNTLISQTVYTKEENTELTVKAEAIISDLENEWSPYRAGSIIEKINNSAGIEAISVSDEMFTILSQCKEFASKTQDLYDYTIFPLVRYWSEVKKGNKDINLQEIEEVKKLVDWQKLILDHEKKTVFLEKKGMAIEFGAALKGYAVEKVLNLYKSANITGALISLGGNVAVTGKKSHNEDFIIGLRDPAENSDTYYAILRISDKIISTSGGYERFFTLNGKNYHHIINPNTGYPCETDLLSVTVISEDGLLSDIMSTFLFMIGKNALLQYLNNTDYQIIAIDTDNKIYISPSIEKSFQLVNTKKYELLQPK